MTATRSDAFPPAHGDAGVLEVVPIPPDGWRLRDRWWGEDPRGLLGYVERDDNGCEAIWLRPKLGSEHFSSLESALQAARGRCLGRSEIHA